MCAPCGRNLRNENVESRREEQARSRSHPAIPNSTAVPATCRISAPGAGCNRQRGNPQDERQTTSSGLGEGVVRPRHATCGFNRGRVRRPPSGRAKFDNEDCILGGQAYKNDEADLRQYIDRHTPDRVRAGDRGPGCTSARSERSTGGSFQLSYCATRTRNTKKAAAPKTREASGCAGFAAAGRQARSTSSRLPCGRTWWASSSIRCSAVPVAMPGRPPPPAPRPRRNKGCKRGTRYGIVRFCICANRADRHHLTETGFACLQTGDVLRGTPELPVSLDDDLVGFFRDS